VRNLSLFFAKLPQGRKNENPAAAANGSFCGAARFYARWQDFDADAGGSPDIAAQHVRFGLKRAKKKTY
jgi:hypothetical protein